MMPQLEIVNRYLSSDKFRKAKDWYSYDYSEYLPYIIEHKSNPKFMFCQLTKAEIPKIPQKVKIHAGSKRFKRKLAEVEEKKAKRKDKSENSTDFWVPKDALDEDEDNDSLGEKGIADNDSMSEDEVGEEEDKGSFDDDDDDDDDDNDDESSDDEFIIRAVPKSVSEPHRKKKAAEASSVKSGAVRDAKSERKEKKVKKEKEDNSKQTSSVVSKKRNAKEQKYSSTSNVKPTAKKIKK